MEKDWIKGKVAVVVGGASGIGEGIALEASKSGAKVVIVDINAEKGHVLVDRIVKSGGEALFVETDVTDSSQVKKMAEAADHFGEVKFLANSPGLQTYGTVDSTSEEDWDRTLNVNMKSIFLVSKEIIPLIRKNGGGGVVNISSIQGLRCQNNVLAYATSKGAVIAMTRSMGLDYAREGISVNCICPGSVDTPLLRFGAAEHGPLEDVLNEWGEHHPIGRIGTPEEIAKTTMFLWSPDSNFMIGQPVIVDGGLGSSIFT